jgi:surface protein
VKRLSILVLFILLSCSKDAPIPEEPVIVNYNFAVSASEGGSVNSPGDSFAQNTTLTLTATAADGFVFSGWSGDASGTTNPLSYSVTANTSIIANFTRSNYSFNVQSSGQGSVAQELVSSAKSTDYESGSTIRLTANSEPDWIFYRWEGLSRGFIDAATGQEETSIDTDNPIEVVVNSSINATATFEQVFQEEENPTEVVGKWKIRKPESTSKANKSTKLECGLTDIIFRADGSFSIITSTTTITGQFVFDSNTSISLTQSQSPFGTITNPVISNNYINFSISLASGCDDDLEGDRDDTYDEDTDTSLPPVISLIGSSTINLEVGETFTDPGATASDDVDGNLTSSITTSGTVNTSTAGTYTISYSVTDAAGNVATVVQRTVIVSVASSISFVNGTCQCPNATVGDTAVIGGVTYTAVDNSTIAGEIANGNVNLCTTLVTDMSGEGNKNFFKSTSFNQDISSWDTSNVTNMEHMFRDATLFNQDISGWDVSNVESFFRTFAYTTAFNQPIGSWDISSATTISGMFRGGNEQSRTVFNQDISSWDTSNVIVMSEVFAYANFNQNIGNWDVSTVRLLTAMFSHNPNFNQDIGGWNLSSMTDANNLINGQNYGDAENRMRGVFRNATSFNQDLSAWCVTDITTEPDFFSDSSALTIANKPIWGTCPNYNINVTASSNSDYTLSGTDRNGAVSGNDPSITINVGDEVNFIVDAASHPFYIKTVQGTGTDNQATDINSNYPNGATNGVVSWKPTAAGTYYYQCSVHDGMYGTITVQ